MQITIAAIVIVMVIFKGLLVLTNGFMRKIATRNTHHNLPSVGRSMKMSSSSTSNNWKIDTCLFTRVKTYVHVNMNIVVTDSKGDETIPLPFDTGDVSFGIYGGGFIPGVHTLADRLSMMDEGSLLSENIDGGEYNDDLLGEFPMSTVPPNLKVGDKVYLSNKLQARITKMTEETMTIDANSVLAGKILNTTMKLYKKENAMDVLHPMTVANGCFWSSELAYQRVVGVEATAVGYTQGHTVNPSYEDVCNEKTGHTEAITILFNPNKVSYESLLALFFQRHDPTQLNRQGNDVGTQYRGGIYYHTDEQKEIATAMIQKIQQQYSKPIVTELLEAKVFYFAEEYHQQYLERFSDQTAKKGATDNIRCYG